jgi:osmotically-inducible protein OsmY
MKSISNAFSAVFLAAALLSVTGCETTQVDTTQYLSDTDVTNKAKVAIYSDPLTKDSAITVSTVKGVVQLTGTVPSEAAKEKAGQLARVTSGATGVKNDLQVVVPAPTTGAQQIIIQGEPKIIIQGEPQPK